MKNKIDMVLIILTVILLLLIVSPIELQGVSGRSMEPTLSDGDLILVLNYAKPKDNDIVIIDTSKVPTYKYDDEHIIKRYYEDKSTYGYYILGDNSELSYDSRYFGEVPKDSVESVMIYHFKK